MPKTKTSKPKKKSILQAGAKAPKFSLNSTPDQRVSLSDFKGRPVVLAFYPADWSPVCTDQLALYNQVLPEFQKFNAEILGISVDGSWSHVAFAKDRNLKFPLLADFEPKGKVSSLYGTYQNKIGESGRALFVIDHNGVIRWSQLVAGRRESWRGRDTGALERNLPGQKVGRLVSERAHPQPQTACHRKRSRPGIAWR